MIQLLKIKLIGYLRMKLIKLVCFIEMNRLLNILIIKKDPVKMLQENYKDVQQLFGDIVTNISLKENRKCNTRRKNHLYIAPKMQFSQRVYHYQSYLNACLKYLSGFFFPQCPQQQYYVGFFKCLACYCYIELNTEVKSNANIKNQQMAKNINYELDVKILIVYYEIILMLMIILLLDIVFLHQDVKLKNQFNPLYLNKIIKEILENYQILIYDQNRFSIINVNAIKVNSNIAFENIVMILAQAFVATLQPDIDSLKMLMNYERSLSLVLQMKLKFLVIVNKQKYFVNKINIIF